jgi:hypothetical protein
MRLAVPAVVAAALLLGSADAAELRSVQVDHARGRYTMVSEVWFDATVDQVYTVFSDWNLSTQFSSVIVESRNIAATEGGRPQYYVRNRGCLLFFCRSFERQGFVERKPNTELRAFANPEISDFKLSDETWRFKAERGGTLVRYRMMMEPDFWVPPGIGPYLIKRKFEKDGGAAIDRIEAIAQRIGTEKVTVVD